MFTFDDVVRPRKPVEIKLAAGIFSVYLEHPTFDELSADDGYAFQMHFSPSQYPEAWKARCLKRLKNVVAWEGVADIKGDPIPFSQDALKKILARHPAAIEQLSMALALLYSTDETSLGELAASPGDSPKDAPADIAPSTSTSVASV